MSDPDFALLTAINNLQILRDNYEQMDERSRRHMIAVTVRTLIPLARGISKTLDISEIIQKRLEENQ